MSEEEKTIKTIKEKLEIIKSLCTDDCINKSVVIEPLEYAIQGLLDLYNKEKEANEYKDNIIKNLGLKTIPKTIIEFKKMINLKYISKDKIREKIKEIKDRKVEDKFITVSQGKLDIIIELEKLLEDTNEKL